MAEEEIKNSVFQQDKSIYNKKIEVEPVPEKNIGIDTKQTIAQIMIDTMDSSMVDKTQLDNFTNITRTRDQVYDIIDQMAEDPTLSAILEAYAEDATEYNPDNGHIVWAESTDANIAKYVQFLLDSMQVDKYIYDWTHSLCKYGDLYLKLYRTSDIEDDDLFVVKEKKQRKSLKEDIKIVAHQENDTYTHYVEMHNNPAELFELTKLGKTYAYIKTDGESLRQNVNSGAGIPQDNYLFFQNTFKFKKNDVYIYPATDYVHACLYDDNSRIKEEVQIFRNDSDLKSGKGSLNYNVRRGQSIFSDVYKIWRILQLLQNSIILSRLTKSAITRIINIEVGDMPKPDVQKVLHRVKSLMEQKTSINVDNSTGEYTNPGPIENLVYVPTHGGQGAITSSEIGGEFDPGQLTDIEYFRDLLYGAMGIPKQFLGINGEGTFDSGKSLALQSAKYAKMVKRIQKTMIEAITDAVNLMLLQKNKSYINKFEIKMLPPTTSEEADRRENLSTQIGLVRDIMSELSDVDDPIIKQKILKSLISNAITNQEVIDLLQEYIKKLETGEETPQQTEETGEDEFDLGSDLGGSDMLSDEEPIDFADDLGLETTEEVPETEEGEEMILPTPEELQVDMTDNEMEG